MNASVNNTVIRVVTAGVARCKLDVSVPML